MKKLYLICLILSTCNFAFAQQSLLVNLGSTTCADPLAPSFAVISNPFNGPTILSNCDLSNQMPNYQNILIAYNPKDNKIYLNDTRYFGVSAIWQVDMGLPGNIACPFIPGNPTYLPFYITNNFEFDNTGRLWSVRNYNFTTGQCNLDQYDILTGNVLTSRTLVFPNGQFPSDIGNGDLCILPNGRLFATFGVNPSRLYEITNYNTGSGNAVATFLQPMPDNCFGIAFLNGKLEVTGTNSIDDCYYFEYDISNNVLGNKINFQNGQAPIDNTSISPIVGVTKQLVQATKISATSAALVYEIYVLNMGNVILNNINVTEDLGTLFGQSNVSGVNASFVSGFNTPGLTLNTAYNGTTNTNLLTNGQSLKNNTSSAADYYFKIQVKCTVSNLIPNKIYYNSAIATAHIGNTTTLVNVIDSSNNGPSSVVDPNQNGIANELGENVPTPFNITTLPVKFISQTVSDKASSVGINWKVAIPVINAAMFIVEYSSDGAHWGKAGEVMITDPNQSIYSFIHKKTSNTNSFYRIKEIDKDGYAIFSPVMKLKGATNTDLGVYPNPANSFLDIQLLAPVTGNTQVELYDAIGQKILTSTMPGNALRLNTTTLQEGVYFLRIINKDIIRTKRIQIIHTQ